MNKKSNVNNKEKKQSKYSFDIEKIKENIKKIDDEDLNQVILKSSKSSTTKVDSGNKVIKKEEEINNKKIDTINKKDINNKKEKKASSSKTNKKISNNKTTGSINNVKKHSLLSKIIFLLDIVLIIFLGYNLFKLKIIPILYVIIAIVTLIILSGFYFVLSQKKARKGTKIFAYFLTIIILVINIIGIYYISVTNGFLDKAFKEGKDKYTNTYYVLVNESSSYNKIEDIKNRNIGYYINMPKLNESLDELKKKISFEKKEYKNIIDAFNDIDNSILPAYLIEKNLYTSLLDSNQNLKDKKYKTIYTFDIEVEEVVEKKIVKGDSYNIYIGGPDFTNTNYDFNMVATVNKTTNKILLTSTPRDYYVTVAGKGMKDILGYAGIWGINTSMKTIENLYGVDMNYFVKINTSSLVGLVDTLGGVEFCNELDHEFTTTHALVLGTYDDTTGPKLKVPRGCKKYSGIEILTIARERLAFPGGDRQRQKNCQDIMISIFKEMASFTSLTKFNQVLDSVSQLYSTNVPKDEVTNMANSMLSGTKWTFEQQSVTGSDSSNYVHLGTVKDYVMIPDSDSLTEAVNKIKKVMDEA